jgi:hypothetical protein
MFSRLVGLVKSACPPVVSVTNVQVPSLDSSEQVLAAWADPSASSAAAPRAAKRSFFMAWFS